MSETGSNLISSLNKSGTGVNLTNLVSGLVEAETAAKQSRITKKVDAANLQISSFGQLSSKLETFTTSLTALETDNARTAATGSVATSLSVTDESIAQDINASMTVSSVAKGQVVTYDLTHADMLNSSSLSGVSAIDTGTLTLTLAGNNTDIVIDSTNNTLQGLVDEINNISGIQASLIDTTGSGGLALVLKSDTGTGNAFSLSSSDDLSEFSSAPMLSETPSHVSLSVVASDAIFTVDGLSITRSSNIITDVFAGHRLDINAVSADEFGIASEVITTDAETRMQSFVDSVNAVKTYLITETKRGIGGASDGSLVGDIAASQILRDLNALTTREITGYGSTSVYLANLGIQTERDGTLSLNSTRFNAALDADPDLLNVVFSSLYSSDNDNIAASGSTTSPPTPGSYSFSYTVGSDATLDDQTITGSANDNGNMIFTSTGGATENLSVRLLSNQNTSGTVRFGQSVIDKLQSYVDDILSSTGLIQSRTTALKNDLSTYSDEQTDLDNAIATLTTNYNLKFGAMESLVTQLNKTGEYLTSMMDAWNKDRG